MEGEAESRTLVVGRKDRRGKEIERKGKERARQCAVVAACARKRAVAPASRILVARTVAIAANNAPRPGREDQESGR